MTNPKFTFVPLPKKVSQTLTDKEHQENLLKWGLKNNLNVKYYNFNEEFKAYDKQDFAECFFHDPTVYGSLNVMSSSKLSVALGVPAGKVELTPVPCSEISMKFFDKLKNDERIVRRDHLSECMDEYVDGMLLQDNLRQMLILSEHSAYNLYDESEKSQFIFRLFKHLCLGGAYAQHGQTLQPYLDLTKQLYKELVDVEKVVSTNELRVRSYVMDIVAYSGSGCPIMPIEPEHPQNFVYLIVDPFKRQVAALYHQFGSYVAG